MYLSVYSYLDYLVECFQRLRLRDKPEECKGPLSVGPLNHILLQPHVVVVKSTHMHHMQVTASRFVARQFPELQVKSETRNIRAIHFS